MTIVFSEVEDEEGIFLKITVLLNYGMIQSFLV